MKLYNKTPGRLKEICKNALDAVEDITRNDVLAALGQNDLGIEFKISKRNK